MFGAGGGNRTHTLLPESDFESDASTSSATPAVPRVRQYREGRDLLPGSRIFEYDVARLADIAIPQELIASARSGDQTAQARLYALLAPAAFALIRRLVGARAIAEDLFQDTMICMLERLDSFRGEAPLGAWVRQIAVSKCLMYLRSPWRRMQLASHGIDPEEFIEAGLASGLPGLVASAPLAESLDLERALATLSPTARAVIWLFEVEGYSHQEIARAFGRTASFSKSQLARAHQRLRAWFEPRAAHEPCAGRLP
jgi:RNA polymerase sigma factor (sigma-70 family)